MGVSLCMSMVLPGMTRQGNYKGRPYSQTTRLGKVMKIRNVGKLYEFAAMVGISTRQLSKYLAGEEIRNDHLVVLSEELGVEGGYLQEVGNGGVEVPKKERTTEKEEQGNGR